MVHQTKRKLQMKGVLKTMKLNHQGGDNAEQDMPTRPQRQRRPPQILTHNSLGNPQYQYVESGVRCLSINPIQASARAAI